jgi:hypothetical protein
MLTGLSQHPRHQLSLSPNHSITAVHGPLYQVSLDATNNSTFEGKRWEGLHTTLSSLVGGGLINKMPGL